MVAGFVGRNLTSEPKLMARWCMHCADGGEAFWGHTYFVDIRYPKKLFQRRACGLRSGYISPAFSKLNTIIFPIEEKTSYKVIRCVNWNKHPQNIIFFQP